jgi:uncharacterized membrane protein
MHIIAIAPRMASVDGLGVGMQVRTELRVRVARGADSNNHQAVPHQPPPDDPSAMVALERGLQNPPITRTVGRPMIWAGIIALLLGISFGWIMSSLGY